MNFNYTPSLGVLKARRLVSQLKIGVVKLNRFCKTELVVHDYTCRGRYLITPLLWVSLARGVVDCYFIGN